MAENVTGREEAGDFIWETNVKVSDFKVVGVTTFCRASIPMIGVYHARGA
jgi:hypothetical protein